MRFTSYILVLVGACACQPADHPKRTPQEDPARERRIAPGTGKVDSSGLICPSPGHVQQDFERWFLSRCEEATAIAVVTTMPAKWPNRDLRCSSETLDPAQSKPCYVVDTARCVKPPCPRLEKGHDLRAEGIQLTDYFHGVVGSPLYLIWNSTIKKPDWMEAMWEIPETKIDERCFNAQLAKP